MKILFCMFQPGFVRHFQRTIGLLSEQGHHVHIAFHSEKVSAAEWTQELRDQHPSVTFSVKAPRRRDEFETLSTRLRALRDYGMYFDRRYRGADRLRAGAARENSAEDQAFVERLARIPGALPVFDRLMQLCELALPSDPGVDAFLDEQAPDVVLVTPLVMFNSPQVDVVKSARLRGVPTGLCVASWDNLTNKGKIRELPDRVMVWNQAQAEEAMTLHGTPRRQIVVTGAQSFDHWFETRPSRGKAEFLAERGLDPSSELILYICSSTSISPEEMTFIDQWRTAVRASPDPRIAKAAILVRPHPVNRQPWEKLDALELPNFAIWPRDSVGPFDPVGRRDYFDSLHHATAVVGLNTSGQVEAGLIGRPVLTILSRDIPLTQYGTTDTLHFQHLLGVNGGLLHVAGSFDEHLDHLRRAFDGDPRMTERSRRFTEAFIRPHGLDRPASPILAQAILDLAKVRPAPHPLADRLTSPFLRPRLKALAEQGRAATAKAKKAKAAAG